MVLKDKKVKVWSKVEAGEIVVVEFD